MFEGLAVLPEFGGALPERRLPARLLKRSEWTDHPPSYPADADELIMEAAWTPFGAHTLALLTAVHPRELSEEGRPLALQTLSRYTNYVEAIAAQFTAEIAGPAPVGLSPAQNDFAAGEIAVATKTGIYAADTKVHLARDLATRLRATETAMRAGDVTLVQAVALSQAVARLDDDTAHAIEARVLRYANRQNLTLFKASITRWASRLDPSWENRSREARREPRVDHQAHADGTGTLTVRAPLEVGPIPAAAAARQLATEGAVLRRLIIDPVDGHLLDHGTRTYTVRPTLADYLTAVNLTSASPYSNIESRDSDMEHNVPYDKGGTTDPLNNTPVDRRWHRAKTHANYAYRKNPETKVVVWTTPGGLSCQIDPYDYRAGR